MQIARIPGRDPFGREVLPEEAVLPGGVERPPMSCVRMCGFMVNGTDASAGRFRADVFRARAVFRQVGIHVEEGEFHMIDDPYFLDHPTWVCGEGLVPAIAQLLSMRGNCRDTDVLAYYVRSIGGGAAGCGGPSLASGRPGFVVTDFVSPNTSAHELGHALGLSHSDNAANLMFIPSARITADPPQLSRGQSLIISRSDRLFRCQPIDPADLIRQAQMAPAVSGPVRVPLPRPGLPPAVAMVRDLLIASEESLDPVLQLGQAAVPTLAMLLVSDPDPIIRTRAAAALGRLDGMAAIQALEQATLQDTSPIVRLTAADALGRLGGPAAEAALLSALRDPDTGVRITAVRSLALLRTPRAQMALAMAAMQEANPRVRQVALRATQGMGV
ncbi:MAG TPA: HEAT repeat domain-containing protein [Symbiobacteriaceae bacterium]|nr:HEAT repeat domain-containing protein [Symbiobacteriaceae bacterium]